MENRIGQASILDRLACGSASESPLLVFRGDGSVQAELLHVALVNLEPGPCLTSSFGGYQSAQFLRRDSFALRFGLPFLVHEAFEAWHQKA